MFCLTKIHFKAQEKRKVCSVIPLELRNENVSSVQRRLTNAYIWLNYHVIRALNESLPLVIETGTSKIRSDGLPFAWRLMHHISDIVECEMGYVGDLDNARLLLAFTTFLQPYSYCIPPIKLFYAYPYVYIIILFLMFEDKKMLCRLLCRRPAMNQPTPRNMDHMDILWCCVCIFKQIFACCYLW